MVLSPFMFVIKINASSMNVSPDVTFFTSDLSVENFNLKLKMILYGGVHTNKFL